jgi:hypothetical protein
MASIRPISERKREANRRNAQRSTGPTSPEGTQHSSRNALKHGLLAKEIVIDTGDGKENKKEFERLLMALVDELKPVGVLQEFLVQEIAACMWKKRRGYRFETGIIRDRADNVKLHHEEFVKTDGISPRIQDELDQLAEVEAALSKHPVHITGEPATWIRDHLGSSCPPPAGHTPDGQPYHMLSDEVVAALRRDVAAERDRLLGLQKKALKIEKLSLSGELKRAVLPNIHWLNILLRYGAPNEKRFDRALEQLTQLQRPAPGGG